MATASSTSVRRASARGTALRLAAAAVEKGRCGRPPASTGPVYQCEPVSLARHVTDAGRRDAITLTCREGSKAALTSKFVFLRVRPAGHRITAGPDGTLPERWLIAQWPDDEPEPVTYWLSSLPADTDPPT